MQNCPGERGSRFGFNAEAVERAARSEGIDPHLSGEDRRRVAWNQLPGLMAVELWREYISKYTLNELFEPGLKPVPEVRQPDVPPATVAAPPTPLVLNRGFATRLLRNFNNGWERELDSLIPAEEPPAPQEELPTHQPAGQRSAEARCTALQIINQMMNARLSRRIVVRLDDCGRPTDEQQISDEYRKLDERGVSVLDVAVIALRLEPEFERQLLGRWTTSWLSNARSDRERIERLETAYTEQGRHEALLDHALDLAEALNKDAATTLPAAVRTLLQATQAGIRANDRLLTRSSGTLDSLQALEKWLEGK